MKLNEFEILNSLSIQICQIQAGTHNDISFLIWVRVNKPDPSRTQVQYLIQTLDVYATDRL